MVSTMDALRIKRKSSFDTSTDGYGEMIRLRNKEARMYKLIKRRMPFARDRAQERIGCAVCVRPFL